MWCYTTDPSSRWEECDALPTPAPTAALPTTAPTAAPIQSGAEGEVHEYVLPSAISHQQAREFCTATGMPGRLCRIHEVCPDGPLQQPVGGMRHGDFWVPVDDSDNSWVSIGDYDSGNRMCQDHMCIWGAPWWDRSTQPYKGTVFCCAGAVPAPIP